jgi:hypothetical protein
VLPCGSDKAFPDRWTEYVKRLGEEVKLDRPEDYKHFIKTVELCLTGSLHGLDLIEFMAFMSVTESAEAQQVVNPAFEAVLLKQRMEILRKVVENLVANK